MDVLGDLVARSRRSDAPALLAPALGRTYDYRRLCTNAWKVGNFLRHLGVRSGRTVALADDPAPEPVLSLFGGALLGASVRFDPPTDRPVDARALVVPFDRVAAYEVPPGTQRVAYGDAPEDPSVAYFERDVWSENPTEPPDRVAPGTTLLRTADATYTHRRVLAAAREVVDRWDLTAEDRVAVRAPLARPGAVVAGVVAPVLVGGSTVLAGADPSTAVPDCGYAVAEGDAPEAQVVAPGDALE
jgi:acyl-CoA synthetase (AMP-forming)/AMP-acid ligase II